LDLEEAYSGQDGSTRIGEFCGSSFGSILKGKRFSDDL